MTDCEKIQELISEMLDGELIASQHEAIEQHIASCPECAAMYADFAALGDGIRDSFSQVPVSLHGKIMKGVKTSPGSKRSTIISLRPYMSAAACLVVIVGALLALRGGGIGFDGSNKAALSTAEAPAAAQTAEDSAKAYSYLLDEPVCEEAEAEYGAKDALDSPAETETAEEPAEEPADEPAELPSGFDTGCAYPALEPWEIELEGRAYPSGTAIDWALLTTYNGKETVEIRYVSDVAALCEILMDSAEFEASELPHDPIALLELQCGSQYYMLKLYTLSESLIAQTSEGCYIAAGTLEEFLSIK